MWFGTFHGLCFLANGMPLEYGTLPTTLVQLLRGSMSHCCVEGPTQTAQLHCRTWCWPSAECYPPVESGQYEPISHIPRAFLIWPHTARKWLLSWVRIGPRFLNDSTFFNTSPQRKSAVLGPRPQSQPSQFVALSLAGTPASGCGVGRVGYTAWCTVSNVGRIPP
jgi:hypothetical protein